MVHEKTQECDCAEHTYARVSYTTSVEIVHEVKQSQPGQKSKIYLAFQLFRVDGRSIDFCTSEWWRVLELHCDELLDLAVTDRFTILVGHVGGHGGSSEELRDAFPLTLYTEQEPEATR